MSELSTLDSAQFPAFEFNHLLPQSDAITPTVPEQPTVNIIIPDLVDGPIPSAAAIWTLRSTPRRSWIWQYGNTILIGNKKYWQCKLCRNNPKKYVEGSTKHPIDHLKHSHRMSAQGLLDATASTSLIRQAFGTNSPKLQFNSDVFKQLIVQWMVECHVSFRQVEEPSFCLLMSYLSAVTASYTSFLVVSHG